MKVNQIKSTIFAAAFAYNRMEQVKQLVDTIIQGVQEKKGSGIVVADLSGIDGTICHYFIICQGNSPSQVEAIADSVGEFARKELDERPAHVVGLENAQWVAMDYGDVLVHIFLPDVRDYYDLEHLWDDATLTRIPDLD
jgi:ribosome-associated protein